MPANSGYDPKVEEALKQAFPAPDARNHRAWEDVLGVAASRPHLAEDQIGATVRGPRRRRIFRSSTRPQRRSRRGLLAALAVVAAGAIAAAAYGGYSLNRPTTIGCYKSDSLTADTAVVTDVNSPVVACAAAWSSAFPNAPQPDHFAACILPSGAIGVFPSADAVSACTRLGLASSTPATSTSSTG